MFDGYKTIAFAGIAFLAEIAKMFGITWDIGAQQEMVNTILIVGGTLGAIIARYNATKNIKTGELLTPNKSLT